MKTSPLLVDWKHSRAQKIPLDWREGDGKRAEKTRPTLVAVQLQMTRVDEARSETTATDLTKAKLNEPKAFR